MPPRHLGYRQIADDLEERTRAGEYPPGTPLPSYSQLARIYSVSVTTVQAALRLLRERGLTESYVGVGTYVVDPLPARLPPSDR